MRLCMSGFERVGAMFLKSFLVAVGLTALGTMAATTVDAAVCAGPDRTFELTVSSGCYAYGTGNVNGQASSDPVIVGDDVGHNRIVYMTSAYVGLDFIKGLSTWTGSSSAANFVGSVTVTASDLVGFTDYVLALKVGNNKEPSWAAFVIAGAGIFDFIITPKQGAGISHINLYGIGQTTFQQIPLPATALLFIVGFAGLLGARRTIKL